MGTTFGAHDARLPPRAMLLHAPQQSTAAHAAPRTLRCRRSACRAHAAQRCRSGARRAAPTAMPLSARAHGDHDLAGSRAGAASRGSRLRGRDVRCAAGDVSEGEAAAPSPLVLLASATPLLAAIGFVASCGGPQPALQAVQDGVAGAGAFAPLYFGAGYVAATVALLPASALTLAAGYLFGPLKGTAIVSASSTLAAALSFLLARSALRPLVESSLRSAAGRTLRAYDAALGDGGGGRVVLLLRLSPLFPFSAGNYLLGLTSVRFAPYVAATWAGALPATFAYVYLGASAEAATAGAMPPFKLALYGLGAVATLAVTKAVSSAATKALEESAAQQEDGDGRL